MVAKWINCRIRERAGDEVEGEVEVGQGEEGEEERDELVDKFDMQQDLSSQGVVGMPDLLEVDQ
jgi:hypothetical protein